LVECRCCAPVRRVRRHPPTRLESHCQAHGGERRICGRNLALPWRRICDIAVSKGHGVRTSKEHGSKGEILPPELAIFLVRSFLSVKSDSVHSCTETVFIFQEILRAKSDAGASMQFDRRPMALPYPYGRRLEAKTSDERRICGRNLALPWRRICDIAVSKEQLSSFRRSPVPCLIPAHVCPRIVDRWSCCTLNGVSPRNSRRREVPSLDITSSAVASQAWACVVDSIRLRCALYAMFIAELIGIVSNIPYQQLHAAQQKNVGAVMALNRILSALARSARFR
jgi:hypothetical protein